MTDRDALLKRLRCEISEREQCPIDHPRYAPELLKLLREAADYIEAMPARKSHEHTD